MKQQVMKVIAINGSPHKDGNTAYALQQAGAELQAFNGNLFRHKVGASVVAVRRTGGSMTFNGLNHYLSISEMLVSSSNYWNVIHGLEPGDAAQDAEGVQIRYSSGRRKIVATTIYT